MLRKEMQMKSSALQCPIQHALGTLQQQAKAAALGIADNETKISLIASVLRRNLHAALPSNLASSLISKVRLQI